jgi:hypothetical protein
VILSYFKKMTDGERRRRRIRNMRVDDRAPEATSAPVPRPPSASSPRPAPPIHVARDEPGVSHSTSTSDVYDDGLPQIPNLSISTMAGGSPEDRDERSLRGLIGGGSSQVSVRSALRARDASRPTDEDIAAAESGLTIIHRGWVPRDS